MRMKNAICALLTLALIIGAAACKTADDAADSEDTGAQPSETLTQSPSSKPSPSDTPPSATLPEASSPEASSPEGTSPSNTSTTDTSTTDTSPADASPEDMLPSPAETDETPEGDADSSPDETQLQFSDLAGLSFWFASGAGAWSTSVEIFPDGTFKGYYHDSEMGSIGEGYPNGSMYESYFHGKFSSLKKIGEFEYSMMCQSLTTEGTVGEERIEDGVKIITTEPAGFDDAEEFLLYLPGKKVKELPEAFLSWVAGPRALNFDNIDELDFFGLYNVNGQAGFGT